MPDVELKLPDDLPTPSFKPLPVYSHVGDLLKLYWDNEPGYAEQINPYVTLIRAFSDKRIVGVKIGGILTLVKSENGMLR